MLEHLWPSTFETRKFNQRIRKITSLERFDQCCSLNQQDELTVSAPRSENHTVTIPQYHTTAIVTASTRNQIYIILPTHIYRIQGAMAGKNKTSKEKSSNVKSSDQKPKASNNKSKSNNEGDENSSSSKLKPATAINSRHILVWNNPPPQLFFCLSFLLLSAPLAHPPPHIIIHYIPAGLFVSFE